jgi:hypothetical protein
MKARLFGLVVLATALVILLENYSVSYRLRVKPILNGPHPVLSQGEISVDSDHHELDEVVQEPMVLGLSYWEQTGGALSNLADLQCWAKTVNISKVAEPSVTPESPDKSVFYFIPSETNHLRFQDLFNVTHWNEVLTVLHNFSPLVSQEYFLQHAVKEFIYVWVKYETWPISCEKGAKLAKMKPLKFLMKRGFRLIKIVCIDFTKASSHVMSEESFRGEIFRGISQDVTVVFDIWRGIHTSKRVALSGTRCAGSLSMSIRFGRTNKMQAISYSSPTSTPVLLPSLRLKRIVDQFLLEHLLGGPYIAVMLRTEKMKEVISTSPANYSCVSGILSDWKEIVGSKNITKTLFFSDIGAHGSMKWNDVHAKELSGYVSDGLQLTLSPKQVNSILEDLTGSKDSVQIALLHQQLVARATCVVMVGGGKFQLNALHTYCHLHRGQECYAFRDGKCNRMYIEKLFT